MRYLEQAWRDLATKASGIIPARVIGAPDSADGAALNDDLLALARMVDQLILSYGRYAQEHIGISEADVTRNFTNVVLGAIEGNATFSIESAIEKINEDGREYLSDVRGWDRAAVEGVD